MFVAFAGLLLAAVVCLFSMLVAKKAQQGLRSSRYQSFSSFGQDTQAAQDKNDLHRFGLPQLLRRTNGGFAAAGMSINTIGVVGGTALLLGPVLASAGPSAIGIGLPLIALFSLCVSVSIAELSSAVPTAGGVYHAAYQLGGRKWGIRAGWLQIMGYLAKLALFVGGFAWLADAMLASRLGYDSNALTFGAAAAVGVLTQACVSTYGSRMAGKLQAGGVWLQLLISCAMLVGLVLLFWPGDYSPVAVYQWLNSAMETSVQPLMIIVGILLLAGMFTGMDGAAHGAEEIIEPRVRVPWAIFLSTSYTYIGLYVLLFFMILVILPMNGIPLITTGLFGAEGLDTYIQYAAAAWGGSAILPILILFSLWQSGCQTMTACSRVVFSMARDEALPFGTRLASVSFRHHLPLQAIWFVAAAAWILLLAVGLLQPGGAFLPLVSASIVSMHLASAIPIGLSWLTERVSRKKAGRVGGAAMGYTRDQLAPWHTGSWSFSIRSVAICWLLLSAVLTAGMVHAFGGIMAAATMLAVTAMASVRHVRSAENRMMPLSSASRKRQVKGEEQTHINP
ncbi:APC family permease [Paenibacillus sp. strain BS8-2]